MPIHTNESTSDRKSIDVTVTPSASGVTVSGSVRWIGDVLYTIPSVVVPCAYVDDESYRVVLASSPPRIVLAENGTTIPDEVCYLARWAFKAPTDTCATVAIEVPRRVLVDRPPTVIDTPVMETYEKPVLDADGKPVMVFDPASGEMRPDSSTRSRQATDPKTGEPLFSREVIPAPPLPEPTVVEVSATPVLPVVDAEKTRGRKRRKRIKALTEDLRVLREAGTTFDAMTAAQKAKVNELVALLADVPLAVP